MTNTTTTTTTTTINLSPERPIIVDSLSYSLGLQIVADGVLAPQLFGEEWSPEEMDGLVSYLAHDVMREEWAGYDFAVQLSLDKHYEGKREESSALNALAMSSLL